MSAMRVPFLRVLPVRTRGGLPIVLLLGRHLPRGLDAAAGASSAAAAAAALAEAVPAGPFVVVYCQGGVGATSVAGVRAFRAAYEAVPLALRARIAEIVCLHVSFMLRAQVYACSAWLACGAYAKLTYCDLLADLERHLGIDAALAGIDDEEDVRYDAEMRTWLLRDHEIMPSKAPDPRKPLLDFDSVDFSRQDPALPSPRYSAAQAAMGSPGADSV